MAQQPGEVFLPNLLTFTNGNRFYGSWRGLRFLAAPRQEEGEEALTLLCWYGENCLEESRVEAQAEFELSDAGRAQAVSWIREQQEIMLRVQAQ